MPSSTTSTDSKLSDNEDENNNLEISSPSKNEINNNTTSTNTLSSSSTIIVVEENNLLNEKVSPSTSTTSSKSIERDSNFEIFFAGVNKSVLESELLELFNKYTGDTVVEIRLIKDKTTGESKGFGFVLFNDKLQCKQAIVNLNGYTLRGKSIQVKESINKRKLFIGNLPKRLSKNQFEKIVQLATPGIKSIDFLQNQNDPSTNRGFAFIEYRDYYSADNARHILSSPTFKIGDSITNLTINWSDSYTGSDSIQSDEKDQIKVLYISDIPLKFKDQTIINQLFSNKIKESLISLTCASDNASNSSDTTEEFIEKVVIPNKNGANGNGNNNFAFVHFKSRELAEGILNYHKENPISFEPGSKELKISFARPIVKKQQQIIRNNNNGIGNIISRHNNYLIPQHHQQHQQYQQQIHNNNNNNNLNMNMNMNSNNLYNNSNNNDSNFYSNNNNNVQYQFLEQQQPQFLNNNNQNQYFQLMQQQQQPLYFNYPNTLRYTPY